MRISEIYQRVDRLFREGRYHDALSLLDGAHAEYPNKTALLFARAKCLDALARYDEAIEICDYLVNVKHFEEAEKLRHNIAEKRSTGPERSPAPVQRRRGLRLVLLSLAGLLTIGGAYYGVVVYVQRAEESVAINDALFIEMQRDAVAARNEVLEARERELAIEKALAKSQPGYVHEPDDWKATAIDGVPLWEPGIYHKVPCIRAPEFDMDVYIPLAYREEPEKLFPYFTICMPTQYPGFWGLQEWAEHNDVILIVMNNCSNQYFKRNPIVQDAVLHTVKETLRVHPRRGMAGGGSGGARTSWNMLAKYGDRFSGLLMIAFGDGDINPLPKHIKIAFLHGDQDFNAKYIRPDVKKLRGRGYEVRHVEFAGGHGGAPRTLRLEQLDWLLGHSLLMH